MTTPDGIGLSILEQSTQRMHVPTLITGYINGFFEPPVKNEITDIVSSLGVYEDIKTSSAVAFMGLSARMMFSEALVTSLDVMPMPR